MRITKRRWTTGITRRGGWWGRWGGRKGWTTAEVKTPKRGVDGEIVGDTNKDGVLDDGETWTYEFVDQKTVTETANTYGVVMGQAVVVRSETKSWACKADGKRYTPRSTGMRNTR